MKINTLSLLKEGEKATLYLPVRIKIEKGIGLCWLEHLALYFAGDYDAFRDGIEAQLPAWRGNKGMGIWISI